MYVRNHIIHVYINLREDYWYSEFYLLIRKLSKNMKLIIFLYKDDDELGNYNLKNHETILLSLHHRSNESYT